MINSVSFSNFRGLEELTLPLASVTILTGVNGVGKTSVLEGLYCLLSETRLDVSPLSRGNKFAGTHSYNYRLFWEECPLFGKRECSVKAALAGGGQMGWSYRRAAPYELENEIAGGIPAHFDSSTEFALWKWKTPAEPCGFTRAQALTKDGGLHLLPGKAASAGYCRYIDFASLQLIPASLSFKTAKRLTAALQILNPRITDVRLRDMESGLSVILDDEAEVSLSAIGNGAITWASTLITIFNLAEAIEGDGQKNLPAAVLIDEIGAGMHYSIMLDIWKFFREFAGRNKNIQFIFTSHSSDCIRAFCEAFMEEDSASVVSLHRTFVGSTLVPTEYLKEDFQAIKEGVWEVRG